jgi:hypothetical protein
MGKLQGVRGEGSYTYYLRARGILNLEVDIISLTVLSISYCKIFPLFWRGDIHEYKVHSKIQMHYKIRLGDLASSPLIDSSFSLTDPGSVYNDTKCR